MDNNPSETNAVTECLEQGKIREAYNVLASGLNAEGSGGAAAKANGGTTDSAAAESGCGHTFDPQDLVAEGILNLCPEAGQGCHRWLFYASKQLQEHGVEWGDDVEAALKELMSRDPNSENEIKDAWNAAAKNEAAATPRWSEVKPARIAEIIESGFNVRDLIAQSPEPVLLDGGSRTAKYLDALFTGNPLVWLGSTYIKKGRTEWRGEVLPREVWRGLDHTYEFVVPSPMAARRGLNKNGKISKRCLDNVGPRKWLVVEFDSGSYDHHAALHWHFSTRMPLACVVFSGGKSCMDGIALSMSRTMRSRNFSTTPNR
jgi:hypothetical protein